MSHEKEVAAIDDLTRKSVQLYQQLVKNPDIDLATSVGRATKDLGKGRLIWNEIKSKLKLRKNGRLLDIGCGYGEVTQLLLAGCQKLSIHPVLIDIPEVIKKVEEDFIPCFEGKIETYCGIFPYSLPKRFKSEAHFDYIVMYSVVHYTDSPELFVEEAVKLLAHGGKLLIGDLANVNRKGRFLATEEGRKFEAAYRKTSVAKIPHYETHEDFVRQCVNHNKAVSDEFVVHTLQKYRSRGFDVFVLPQSERLPYGKTREDMLIVRK